MNRKIVFLVLVPVLLFSVVFGARTMERRVDVADSGHSALEVLSRLGESDVVDWWPMFHHDLKHVGYSTSVAPSTNQTFWVYSVGGQYVQSAPAVADGKVFVAHSDSMPMSCSVYALNSSNGAQLWKYTTGDRIMYSSPAVAEGKVFVGSDDKRLYALDESTGALVWSYLTGSFVRSSPTIVDGRVYVGSCDKKVYALNATTGTCIWNYTTGGVIDISSPAVADGTIYIGSQDCKIYALNSTTGSLIWTYTTGGAVHSSPAVADGRLFVGSDDHKVYALNISTSASIWSYSTGEAVYSSPAVAFGKVFIGSDDHKVYALNCSSGTLIWSYLTGHRVSSSPAIAEGKVFIGSADTKVYAISESTGTCIWSYITGNCIDFSSPAIADGRVYIGSCDYKVYAFGSRDVALVCEPVTQWNKTCGGTSSDIASSVVQTGDGGYALAGYTYSCGAGDRDFWFVRTDSAGNVLWNKTYGGTNSEFLSSLIQTSDGGYALAGESNTYTAGGFDAWLVKTDSSGNMLWNRNYGGTSNDGAYAVVQTSDGGYTVAGYTYSYGVGQEFAWLIKTDFNGNMQWNKTYGGEFFNAAYSAIQTSDGGYALAGPINGYGAGDWDCWFVKTDQNGNELWNKTYGGAYQDEASSIIQTSDGGYMLAGRTYSYGAGDYDAWLVKTDLNGNTQWNKTYGGTGAEQATFGLVQTADGGYAFAGYTGSYGAGGTDFWLVKTDSTGNEQWDKTYGGAKDDSASDMISTSDGGYALAGSTKSFGAGNEDFWLIKTGPGTGVDKQTVCPGQNVSITILVKNEGTITETFNVTAYYNATAIETKTVINLESGEVTTLTFMWNITDEPLGNYIISAYAYPVPGEVDTANNNCTVGVVRVMLPWDDWNHYHDYDEIVNTLIYLNATYPNIVDVFSIGKSWLNQDIYCIRLTSESNTHQKPKVFFVGYHHARELISAELALYFAVDAATSYGTNETVTRLLNYSEIYIVPALNVDGFNAVKLNEWQRKNIHPIDEDGDGLLDEDPPNDENGNGYIEDLLWWNGTSSQWEFVRWEGLDNDGDGLLNEDWVGGVDLNRNYGYQWNATCYTGSPYTWAEDYRGPAPFSEPETQAIRDLALSHDFKYAISFHSGAEVIGYPWGYTTDPTPDDATFRGIAANLSSLTGAPYGPNSGMYTGSGEWDDWMYANRSTYALTCEIYTNSSAWQYEPGPEPDTLWERGVFQFFNPDSSQIEPVIQRWLPVFTYTTNRAITEAYDTATTSIVPAKTIVGQGYAIRINATVQNQGEYEETVEVTAYANTTITASQNVTLATGNSTIITFIWNTTGFAMGNYTISAYAWPVPGETNTINNNFTGGVVKVTIPGDINGDFKCALADLSLLAKAYNTYPGDAKWNPNADINGDGKVALADLSLLAKHYNQHYP